MISLTVSTFSSIRILSVLADSSVSTYPKEGTAEASADGNPAVDHCVVQRIRIDCQIGHL